MTKLIEPYGGELKELVGGEEEAAEWRRRAVELACWDLSPRQLCDVEMLLCGGFSPLEGFMTSRDYDGVVERMRLADGTLWPVPVTLDVTEEFAAGLKPGSAVALRDPEGVLLAILEVEDLWKPDRAREAALVYGTEDCSHPGVNHVMKRSGPWYAGGRLRGVELPVHYDFKKLRDTPSQLRQRFSRLGWHRVVAFQTRNPMHRAHLELTLRAALSAEANLLIHPIVGLTQPGDIDYYSRVRCYEHILRRYPEQSTALSLLPLAMRMAGPREALWHAIIRRNYGCTHFIVGRHHASPGKNGAGEDFYGPYDAQELVARHEEEVGVAMVPFRELVYVEEKAGYVPADEVAPGETVRTISGTEFRRRLREGLDIPEWFSYPEVVEELRKTYPPRHRQGFTVFFTGLSGAGKSTIAKALMVKLLEIGGRPITLLDGDIVRKNLSSELGFSKEHRDLNILRIGFVAGEITKNGGIAICAPIAPYAETRRRVRELISGYGGFFEVYVSTSLEVCEARDRKGLYAKARAGIIKEFTGISDPYEAPVSPEMEIDTEECLPDEAAQKIILRLEKEGYIK
ncbi:MAG TPA: bifunctional sulfate adenylyltransferase/adenylylsulfate kinase [Deltaproteobacteria bacterium]|nr:bifunctional sulfate adenylyltransferase/adenylylsulfate kinase [Deltaproteobacteria bacterium]